MRIKLVCLLALGFAVACDQVKDDVPPTVDLTTGFAENKPVIVRLNSFVDLGDNLDFQLAQPGNARLIAGSFLTHVPQDGETVTVDIIDASGTIVSKANVNFEKLSTGCGIAEIKTYSLSTNEILEQQEVASPTLICEPIGSAWLSVTDVENTEGLSITMPRPSTTDQQVKVLFSYTPPAGFKGTVRALYTLGLNVKPEHAAWFSGISTEDEFLQHPEYFKFFTTGMVEIAVTE